MDDLEAEFDLAQSDVSPSAWQKYSADIEQRCKANGIDFERFSPGLDELGIRVGIKSGRSTRWLYLATADSLRRFSEIAFEHYRYISNFEAIYSLESDTIEAALESIQFSSKSIIYRGLFGINPVRDAEEVEKAQIRLEPPHSGWPLVEIGKPTAAFGPMFGRVSRRQLTIKISGGGITTHDQASSLLRRTSDALFFQIDMLSGFALGLERERIRRRGTRAILASAELKNQIRYPTREIDEAPASLYWYARSASGMPLLQFLAFYQTIEFYFPIYSQAEAKRKVATLLKDPTFRSDRDTDISRLLSAVRISRSGGFGDERSQLRATISECVDPDSLRIFLESDPSRKEFYQQKPKDKTYHRIPLGSADLDLRQDVADRIYDIRCKIVHTKNDARDGELELLLPFTKEAEQLSYDIELVQYVARAVLITASSSFGPQSKLATAQTI